MLHSRTQVSRFLPRRSWQQLRCAGLATSQPSEGSDEPGDLVQRPPILERHDRTAFIRTTKSPESLADAFTLIRAVESRYGAVTEYQFVRDFEVSTKYQNVLHVTFRDPESIQRISAASDVLRVPAPPIVQDRPGGIGLDELEGLLERQEYVKEAVPGFSNLLDDLLQNGEAENDRVIEFTVKRSRHQFFAGRRAWASAHPLRFRDATARNFINWGGFYDIKPIEKSTRIANEDLFGTSPLDHIRMRRTLRKWSYLSGIPNPYEYSPDLEQVTEPRTDHVEWEPLPGHASTPDEAFTLSSDKVTPNPPQPLPTVTPNNTKTTSSPPSTDPEQKLSGKPLSSGRAQTEALLGLTDVPTQVLSSTPKGTNRSDVPTQVLSSAPKGTNRSDVPTQVLSSTPKGTNRSDVPTQVLSSAPKRTNRSDVPTQLSSTPKGTNRSDGPSHSIQDRKATQLKAARNLVKRANEQRKKSTSAKALDSTRKPTLAKNSNFTRPPDDILPEKRNYSATERLKSFFRALF